MEVGSAFSFSGTNTTHRPLILGGTDGGFGTDTDDQELSDAIIAPGEGSDAVLYLGTPYEGNRDYALKAAIIAEGVNNFSRSKLHFALDGNADNSLVNTANVTDSKMTILSNGNVGIGTMAPTENLSVNGSAGKNGGGSWSTFSDRRIKSKINPYTKGLNEILQIRPIIYFYNATSPFKHESDFPMVGVIPQEIKEVLPSTVSTKKTEHYDDLFEYDSSELIYTLINAVK